MTVRTSRLRARALAVVFILAAVNAMAFWGPSVADTVAHVLQIGVGVAAIACGLAVARRQHGTERWWRLALVAALADWVLGQALWRVHMVDWSPLLARVIFMSLPVLVFATVVLLVRSSGGVTPAPGSPLRQPFAANVLDGVIAALAFLILAVMSDLGTRFAASGAAMRVLDLIFIGADIFVVGVVMLIATVYDPARPNRTNYLLLAGGLLLMAVSNRLLAYLRSVDMADAAGWVSVGLIVGLALLGFAFLPTSPTSEDIALRRQDWPQLLLPYVSFLGIAALFAFHLYIERELSVAAVCLTVAMVALVATRQVVATRAERSLTQSLYRAQRGLEHQVNHDTLTGLPNRKLFAQRLDEAMRHGHFVLIYIDLDDFKEVNDRYGHAAGDELLCAVGERLARIVGEKDTLARIGGDEFAILIEDTDDHGEQLEAAAGRLRLALREPFPVHGSSLRVKASMGLVRPDFRGMSQTSDDLLRQADISMYASKRMGKDTAVVYEPSSGAVVGFSTLLRSAKGEPPPGFRLVYQPVVQLEDETPVAVEALARWTAANGIDISAETFVAEAEAAGLGADLDALVLDLACREVRGRGLTLDIHVNIGGARLGNPAFEQQVRAVLERYQIPRHRLVLEITETMPIVDLGRAARQIHRFGELGVKVALDDFGSGFSSLTYLHELPVDIVKLDRSLASGSNPARDQTLYRSVIKLCDDLGLDVIAEGVETVEQADMVSRAGGRLAQGHLFGRPVPIGDLVTSLAAVQGQA